MKESKARTKETLGHSGAIALFDIDKTLVDGFIIFPFVDMLIDQGVLNKDVSAAIKADFRAHKNKKVSYQEFADNVVAHYCQGLEGKSQREVETVGRQFLAFVRPVMLCDFSQELVNEMNRHAKTIAISGAPVEVLRPLTEYLNIAETYGLEAEVSNGTYTGRVKTNMAVRTEKERQVSSLINSGCLVETSFAFGDSDSDVPILQAVGNPFAVNPNQALEKIATANGWEIVNSENILSRVRARLAKLRPNQP